MGGNRIKWIIGGLFVVLLVIAALNRSGEDAPTPPTGAAPAPAGPQRPDVGPTADSDTMTETLKTVQAQYGEQRRTNEALRSELTAVREQLAHLEAESQASAEDDTQSSALAAQIEKIQARLDQMMSDSSAELPDLGFGGVLPGAGSGYQVDDGSGHDFWLSGGSDPQSTGRPDGTPARGYVRLTPLVPRQPIDEEEPASREPITAGFDDSRSFDFPGSGSSGFGDRIFGTSTPLATIPARSTLFDATAMTALIGRVPISGQVVDPFPVKIIVGDDNLAANGHHIPELRGIIFDGIARGDWTMGCVSVNLTGATYVFDDGTISHLSGTTGVDDSIEQGAASLYGNQSGDSIGYISDVQGTPCLRGTKITDAYKQATIATAIGGLQGWAEYRADAERTTTTGAGSGVVVDSVTGDRSAFSRYGLAATGLGETLQIIKDRFEDTFDAIYIPPGQQVALHIARDLHIVHHSNAAKIVYDQDLGSSHGFD